MNVIGTRRRKGTIYTEYAPKRFVRGVGLDWRTRYVGEITVNGYRYRCRSTNINNVRAWLNDMIEKYPTY